MQGIRCVDRTLMLLVPVSEQQNLVDIIEYPSKDILRAVEFPNTMLSEINGSFWLNNGLLVQCARARNLSACKILLQHVEDLLDSANIKLGASSLASTELEEWIAIVDRQACTRAMSRHITSTMDVVKMLLGAVEKDIRNANELTLALNSGVKSC